MALKPLKKSQYSSKSLKSGLGTIVVRKREDLVTSHLGIKYQKKEVRYSLELIKKDEYQEVKTSQANLVTSDESILFVRNNQRTDQQLGQYYVTPVNPGIVRRQFSQEHLLLHRPKYITPSSGGSDWTKPRKERQVGSPGNTANADFFIKQHTPSDGDLIPTIRYVPGLVTYYTCKLCQESVITPCLPRLE